MAINNYNDIAKEFKQPELDWEDVIEYAFLAEFDLLWDGCGDVRQWLWSTLSARML